MLAEASQIVDVKPFIGVISQGIMWVGFLTFVVMIRGIISKGVCMAVCEILNNSREETVQRVVRWFTKSDQILEAIEELKEGEGETGVKTKKSP